MLIGHFLQYKCCGVTSPNDWMAEIALGGVPDSCKCVAGSEDCEEVFVLGYIYTVGCYTKLEPTLRDLVDAMGGIAIAVSLLDVRFRLNFN
jgi:Tetraspanin family